MIIRRVSGQFYGDFLRENIFIPAGMRDAHNQGGYCACPRRVAGYRLVAKQIKNQEWVAPVNDDGGWGAPRDASRSYRLGAGGRYSSTPQRRELVENFPARDASKRSGKARMDLHGNWSDKVEKIFIIMTGSWQGFETLLIGTLTTTCRSFSQSCRCRIETTRRQNRGDRKRRGIAGRMTPPMRASRVPVGAPHWLDHDPVSAYPSRRGRSAEHRHFFERLEAAGGAGMPRRHARDQHDAGTVRLHRAQLGQPFCRLPILRARIAQPRGDEHGRVRLSLHVVVGRVAGNGR